MNALLETLQSWLSQFGIDLDQSAWLAKIFVLLALLALCAGVLWITRPLLLRVVRAASARTGTEWDDELVKAGVFARLSYLVPTILSCYDRLLLISFHEYRHSRRTR